MNELKDYHLKAHHFKHHIETCILLKELFKQLRLSQNVTVYIVIVQIFSFQFYWDLIDIQHCKSLRCTAQFDLHTS